MTISLSASLPMCRASRLQLAQKLLARVGQLVGELPPSAQHAELRQCYLALNTTAAARQPDETALLQTLGALAAEPSPVPASRGQLLLQELAGRRAQSGRLQDAMVGLAIRCLQQAGSGVEALGLVVQAVHCHANAPSPAHLRQLLEACCERLRGCSETAPGSAPLAAGSPGERAAQQWLVCQAWNAGVRLSESQSEGTELGRGLLRAALELLRLGGCPADLAQAGQLEGQLARWQAVPAAVQPTPSSSLTAPVRSQAEGDAAADAVAPAGAAGGLAKQMPAVAATASSLAAQPASQLLHEAEAGQGAEVSAPSGTQQGQASQPRAPEEQRVQQQEQATAMDAEVSLSLHPPSQTLGQRGDVSAVAESQPPPASPHVAAASILAGPQMTGPLAAAAPLHPRSPAAGVQLAPAAEAAQAERSASAILACVGAQRCASGQAVQARPQGSVHFECALSQRSDGSNSGGSLGSQGAVTWLDAITAAAQKCEGRQLAAWAVAPLPPVRAHGGAQQQQRLAGNAVPPHRRREPSSSLPVFGAQQPSRKRAAPGSPAAVTPAEVVEDRLPINEGPASQAAGAMGLLLRLGTQGVEELSLADDDLAVEAE